MLSSPEIQILKDGCARLGRSLKKVKRLTVKGHIVDFHIPLIVDRFGTCGMFLEDGIEALHPLDNECRLLTRNIRNALKRVECLRFHILGKQTVTKTDKTKRHRRSKSDMAAARASS